MKKATEKKLSLGKIKIAKLSNAAQDMKKGGAAPTYGVCSNTFNRCIPPPVE